MARIFFNRFGANQTTPRKNLRCFRRRYALPRSHTSVGPCVWYRMTSMIYEVDGPSQKSSQRKNLLKAKIEKHIKSFCLIAHPSVVLGNRVSTQTVLINSGTKSDRSFCPSIPSPHGWPQQAHSSLQGEQCPGATESSVASWIYLIHLDSSYSISLLASHCLPSAFIFARKCTPQWVFRSSPLPVPQDPRLCGPFHHLLHVVVRDLRCFLQVVDDGAVSTDHGIADTMDVTWKYLNHLQSIWHQVILVHLLQEHSICANLTS